VVQAPAGHLSGDVSLAEADALYKKIFKRQPEIRLLYVTPEKVQFVQMTIQNDAHNNICVTVCN